MTLFLTGFFANRGGQSGIKLYFSVPVVFKLSRTTAAYETKHIVVNFLVLGCVICHFYKRGLFENAFTVKSSLKCIY